MLFIKNKKYNHNSHFLFFYFTVKPSDLQELSGLFGDDIVESALDLIDSKRLKLYTTTKNIRQFIEIEPNYQTGLIAVKLFPNINYCPCEHFRHDVLLNDNQYTCKHVLATKLAIISGKISIETVADDLFNFLIQQINEQYFH